MVRFKIIILVSCLFFFYGCATIYNPATQKKEFIFIDTKQEVALGKLIYSQVIREMSLSKDEMMIKRLNLIGEKVNKVCDRQDLEYKFNVVKDKELNAFAIPGGFVFINSGLMETASDNELACVVGHEIGHVAAKHAVKRLQVSLGYAILINLALAQGNYVDAAQAVDIIFNIVSLGYSREDERLSDRLAVKYAFKAGYNPDGMISFFRKLEEESRKKGNTAPLVFLSSHPPVKERIENMAKEIAILRSGTQFEAKDAFPTQNNK
jgi:predicted Zn-dependent protease